MLNFSFIKSIRLRHKLTYTPIWVFILLLLPCFASTHIPANSFKEIQYDIIHKWGENLENTLIAIDIDRTSLNIDSLGNVHVLDSHLPDFIYFLSAKGAKILFLTARSYSNGNNRWTIDDLSIVDAGKVLKHLVEKWKSCLKTSNIFIKFDYLAINLRNKPELNKSLFQEGILFSRARGQDASKGLCLKKFLKVANLNSISKVVLIDDDRGYLDEFQETFSAKKSDVCLTESLTYHFVI